MPTGRVGGVAKIAPARVKEDAVGPIALDVAPKPLEDRVIPDVARRRKAPLRLLRRVLDASPPLPSAEVDRL